MPKILYLIAGLCILLAEPGGVLAQKYVVAGDFDYAPFSFIDKTGKPSGLDVDVLDAIAASSGIQLSYQLSPWENALSSIQSGKADIIVGIIFSEDREAFLDFSIPIHAEHYSIFIRKDLSLEELSILYDYKPVILAKDVSIEKYLMPMGLLGNHVVVPSLPEALSVIELGLADYVLAPNLLGLREIERNRYQNIEIKGPAIIPSIYCFAVAKGNTELLKILNEGIAELRKNGQLTAIQQRWKVYETEDSKYKRAVALTGVVLSITAVSLLLVLAWAWLLRLQVKRKTESIEVKNLELQKSEEKFRIITENSSDVIWHLDANFCVTYVSQADRRIRGFDREEVIGKSLFSILKPEGIELLKEANKKRMLDLKKGIRSAPVVYELEELCKDGSWVWVEATATAFYNREGNVSGYHGVTRDISERKEAELLLKQREMELRELNSTKDKLFSIIAHDLRSPFNAILNLSDLLIENNKDIEPADARSYLEMIHSSAENTLVLLDNLLAWAKSQTGAGIYQPEIVSLPTIIREVMDASTSIAKAKGISLNYTPAGNIEVYADVNMLKTVLRNLVSNAIKYTHSDGNVVVSSLRNKDRIEVSVSDNGVGMNDEVRNHLFRIDVNLTTAGTAHEKGSGLGLILCREFIERHGGEIRVESELGKGSDFVISLPAKGS
ncbi:MAG: transporter substrate-binding domain-containing protein [Opitutales bacterium]|nr:transporter substrate-binding domain-containing protein [Opitutales bacterium]